MPTIIPIKDLKDTQKISALCHESDEPVYVTKNGYNDLVVMSQSAYDKEKLLADIRVSLAESESDVAHGRISDAKEALAQLRGKHGV